MSKLIVNALETLDGTKSLPVQHINRAEASTYDSGDNERTIESVLDTIVPIADYAALRAYRGRASQVRITNTDIAGFFKFDQSDTTSADNGSTIIVAGTSRWKRIIDYSYYQAVEDSIPQFISGQSISIGEVRYSQIDLESYRAKTAGVHTIDPSIDDINWHPLGLTQSQSMAMLWSIALN
jgi:copper chaperone CopZ